MRLISLLFFIISQSVWSQSLNVDSLDNYISKLTSEFEYGMPGLAIGVIQGDSVLFKKGYGVTRSEQGFPVSTQTIFPILSCTKAFTATCIGILVDEGKLNWEDKVVEHLPDFKLSDPWITKAITIGDLLSHRSGLGTFDGDLLWYGSNYSTVEVIEKIQYYPLKGDFRLDFNYNNIMYLVAGRIVEKTSGLKLDEFLQTRIFDVLGMKHSFTKQVEVAEPFQFASPHIAGKPIQAVSLDNAVAAGGIKASLDDMILWLRMYLNKGTLDGKRIISEDTYRTITSPKIILNDHGLGGYGFGWYIDYDDSEKTIYHGGGMPGYKSMVAIYPEYQLGIVVLTNQISLINEGLVNMIAAYLKDPSLVDWSNNRKYFSYFTYSWDNPKQIKIKPNLPDDFSQYIGRYQDQIYGQARVIMNGTDAILELLPSKDLLSGKLYYLGNSRYKIKLKDPFLPLGEVVFERNENHEIIGFRLEIPNDDFNFDNLNFQKILIEENNAGNTP